METKQQEKQALLNITDKVTEKYHIKFDKQKCQSLNTGNNIETPIFLVGQMKLDTTDKYKYLSEIINTKFNLKD